MEYRMPGLIFTTTDRIEALAWLYRTDVSIAGGA